MNRAARLTLAAAAWLAVVGAAPAAPRRIVTLNPCLDAIVVGLVEPSRIVGISHYSRDADASLVAEAARRLPVVGETAEEIAQARPDLVLTSRHMSLSTRRALTRLKVPLAEFDVPNSVEESYAQVRRIAALTGRQSAGDAMIAGIAARLDRARPAPGARLLPAMIFHSSGFTPGAGTLPDDLLRRTGFSNAAAPLGKGWGKVTLEQLVSRPPALLIASVTRSGGARELQHPVLRGARTRIRQVTIPSRLLYCGGPTIPLAAEAFAAIRARDGR